MDYESDDIIDCLDNTFPEQPLCPAKEADLLALHYWLKRATSIHLSAVKTYVYHKSLRGKMRQSDEQQALYTELQKNKELLEFHRKSRGDNFSEQDIQNATDILDQCFNDIESVLQDNEWLVGDQFSLADIAWVPLHFTLKGLAGYSFDAFPGIERWRQLIEARPSFKKAVLDWRPVSA